MAEKYLSLELELKKKQENIEKAYQTYLDLKEEANEYQQKLLSILTTFSFDKNSVTLEENNPSCMHLSPLSNQKEYEVTQTETSTFQFNSKDLTNEISKFRQYLSSLSNTHTSHDAIQHTERTPDDICEYFKQRLQLISGYYETLIEKSSEEFKHEKTQLVQQMESKEQQVEKLQADVKDLQTEKHGLNEKILKIEANGGINMLKGEPKKRDNQVLQAQKKVQSIENNLLDESLEKQFSADMHHESIDLSPDNITETWEEVVEHIEADEDTCTISTNKITVKKKLICDKCNEIFTSKKNLRYHFISSSTCQTRKLCIVLCNAEDIVQENEIMNSNCDPSNGLSNHLERNIISEQEFENYSKLSPIDDDADTESSKFCSGLSLSIHSEQNFITSNQQFQQPPESKPLDINTSNEFRTVPNSPSSPHGRRHLRAYSTIPKSCVSFECISRSEKLGTKKTFKRCQSLHKKDQRFLCDICERTFASKRSLMYHAPTHTDIRPFACNTCEKTFYRYDTLKYHQKTHTNERPFACGICGRTFKMKPHLYRHNKIHSNERPFACKICEKTFYRNDMLKMHQISHTNERFACRICGKGFKTMYGLNNHRKTHTKPKALTRKYKQAQFLCKICKKSFKNYNLFCKHKQITHKAVICTICNKAFRSKESKDSHQKVVHKGLQPYKCDRCGKAFGWKGNLNVHYRIHTGERPFKCKFCQKAHVQKINRDNHQSSCKKNPVLSGKIG